MWKNLTISHQLSRAAALSGRQHTLAVLPVQTRRTFTAIPPRYAQPQDEEDHYHDRNKLNPSPTGASQSATNDEVATQDTAFDPAKTAPEDEVESSKQETASKGNHRDPLTVSAGDKDVSSARDPLEGGAEKNVDKPERTTRSAPIKNRHRK